MRFYLLVGCLILSGVTAAQERKVTTAVFFHQPPATDGVLDDPVWSESPVAGDFVQYQTRPGEHESQTTGIRVGYDHTALYIAASMFDSSPDSILRETGTRDQENTNADEFAVIIDTYNDRINAFEFRVTAAGVQIDARHSANGQDLSWNAVWYSRISSDSLGWYAEFKIPFSAIRFTSDSIQTWGINFSRSVRRYREISYWNFVNPQIEGIINQSGQLTGIVGVNPPVRLSFTPYIAAYTEGMSEPGHHELTESMSAGLDLKYGLSESFTLDLTLIPDFSQVQSDNLVLNLSPFEVRYNEFRPFFTEGTELFNKGGFFYSRRVGGTPVNYSEVEDYLRPGEALVHHPSATQLINAFKLSGRTSGGLGIGVFNAVTAPTFSLAEDVEQNRRRILTSPLTNYSVIVGDLSLKNNSYLSLVNTSVMRNGHFEDANVTGGLFRLVNKKNTLAISGKEAISLTPAGAGHYAEVTLSKISGRLNAMLQYIEKSDDYNINDLGFEPLVNTREAVGSISFNRYKPFWKVNNFFNTLTAGYSRLYAPDAFWNLFVSMNGMTTFTRNFFTTGYYLAIEPIVTYDHFEPRTPGYFYAFPVNYLFNGWVSSDYRKKLAVDAELVYRIFEDHGRNTISLTLEPRWRLSNKVMLIFEESVEIHHGDLGFAGRTDDGAPILGRRDVTTWVHALNGRVAFSPLMNLLVRFRHYWSQAAYEQFHLLDEKGGLLPFEDSDRNHDVNFNALNLDLIYTWNFAPGSEINVTLKVMQLEETSELALSYFDNVYYLADQPRYATLSLKLLYFIDYSLLKERFRGAGEEVDKSTGYQKRSGKNRPR